MNELEEDYSTYYGSTYYGSTHYGYLGVRLEEREVNELEKDGLLLGSVGAPHREEAWG